MEFRIPILQYLLLFVILFFNFNVSQAQDKPAVKSEVRKMVDSIYRIQYKGQDMQRALLLCKEALAMAEKQGNPDETLMVYNRLGGSISYTDDQKLKDKFLTIGLQLAKQTKAMGRKGSYYHYRSQYYKEVGPLDSAAYYAKKSLEVKRISKDTTGVIAALTNYAFSVASDPDTMIHYLEESLELAIGYRDSTRMAIAHGNIGTVYLNKKNDFVRSMERFESSNEIFTRMGKPLYVATGYYNISRIYKLRADYENAIKYGLLNLEIRRNNGDDNGAVSALKQIGDYHVKMNRDTDALNYYHQARTLAESRNMNTNLVHVYTSLGEYYLEIQQDSAEYYFLKNLKLAKEIDHDQTEGTVKINLGSLYAKQNKYELAENYILDGLRQLEDNSNLLDLKPGLLVLTEMYLEWFDKSKGDNTKGPLLQNVENILEKFESTITGDDPYTSRMQLYQNYSKLYEAKKDYANQVKYQSKLVALQDSFIVNRNIEVANEYAEKLKTSEKEKEIIALEAENKIASFRNSVFSYALGGTVLFFGLLFYLFRRFTKIRQKENQLQENQKFRTRLSRNLHDDVSSMLNSLAMQTELAAMEVSPDKKSTFDDIVIKSRQAVQNMRDTVWAIDSSKDKYENLLDRIVDYAEDNLNLKNFKIDIEKYNWKKDVNILPEHRQNIYLVFKEAITNILKHSKGDLVKIGIGFKQNNFVLDVENNGEVNRLKKSGVGTESMIKRANEIGGEISFAYDDGFKVSLKMPLV
jgi:signal transduction histidine kinase